MHMVKLLTTFLFLCTLDLAVQAGEVHVAYRGISAYVHLAGIENQLPAVTFRHPEAGFTANAKLPLQSLTSQVEVPSLEQLTSVAVYKGWRPIASFPDSVNVIPTTLVEALGTREWKPIAKLTVWPWRSNNGRLEFADTVEVTIQCSSITDYSPVVTQDRSWYDPRAPYVRIHTSTAGIGAIIMNNVVAIEPRFKDVPESRLKLVWRGTEQPIYIVDAGMNSVVDLKDTILFQSRFAQGDTSFLSMEDSTAVMFLTVQEEGERERLKLATGITSQSTLQQVKVKEHFELDTGYYHLGSAYEDDKSAFVTGLAYLEGFYWANLNTSAYGRSKWSFRLTPAPDGDVNIKTLYAIGTDIVAYNPDSRFDISVNGGTPIQKTTDGFGNYVIESIRSGRNSPSGLQSIKWYATGIDSLRKYNDYFSQVLVDAVEVNADVLPVLDSGRFRAHIPVRTTSTNISWYNAANNGWWIDTTTKTIGMFTATRPGTVIRGGLAPIEPDWPTDTPNQKWRVCSLFGDKLTTVDTLSTYVLTVWVPTVADPSLHVIEREQDLIAQLNQVPLRAQVVIAGIGNVPSSALQSVLSEKNIPVPTDAFWVTAGVVGEAGYQSSSQTPTALGATYLVDRNNGTGTIADTHIPPGDSTTLFVSTQGAVEIARVMPSHLSNLTADSSQVDMLIVTHSTHRQQAERLAAHRRKHNGLAVSVVDVDEILDEFAFGEHKPEAIQSYLSWRYTNSLRPRLSSVLLFGNASWDIRLAVKKGNVNASRADQVPTFGRPSSDYFFGLLDNPSDLAIQEATVGRLPALSVDDGRVIVDKIIFNDTVQFQPWMRTWFFVGGGKASEGLCDVYQDMLSDPFGSGVTFTTPPLCIDTATLCKSTAPPNAGFYIRKQLDAGVQWMNFIGHGATDIFDINGWEPSELNNTGRYGILATYACQTGSYSNPSVPCKNSQYLLEPSKGMIGAYGTSGWQYIWAVNLLHQRIHEVQRAGVRSLGGILSNAIAPLYSPNQTAMINTVLQYALLGDPNSRLFLDTVPRLVVSDRSIHVKSRNGVDVVTDRDSTANVTITIANEGTGTTSPCLVRLKYSYGNAEDSLEHVLEDGICSSAIVEFSVPVLNRPGDHRLTVYVDPLGTVEAEQAKHIASASFNVIPQSLLPLEPVMFEQFGADTVHVRMIDPQGADPSREIHFAICDKPQLEDATILVQSTTETVQRTGSIIDWQATIPSLDRTNRVYLGAWTTRNSDTSVFVWLPFDVNINEPARANLKADVLMSAGNQMVQIPNDSGWTLNAFKRRVYLKSIGTSKIDAIGNPPLIMSIGTTTYVQDEFYRGINLIVVGKFDTVPRAIRRYDTWRDPLPPESGNNGSTTELLRFLRDSVTRNDLVLFASCNESFSGFRMDSTLDSFRVILKDFGSRFADSLYDNSSWVMIGQPGSLPLSAIEAWKGAPDSLASITDTLTFYQREGSVYTPLVGPGVRWDSVELDYDTLGVTAFLYAEGSDGVVQPIGVLGNGVNIINDMVKGKNAKRLQVTWLQHHISNASSQARIRGARFYYQPAHELHLESTALSIVPDNAQRGDSVIATLVVRNADRRFSSSPTTINVAATSRNGLLDTTLYIPSLVPDSSVVFQVTTSTELFNSTEVITAQVDRSISLTEFYRFNNSCNDTLLVFEDSLPPVISVTANNVGVVSGDFVSAEPFFAVSVTDNSRLKISDETKLMVFVNGTRIRSDIVPDYTFWSTDSCLKYTNDLSLRAKLFFTYPMEVGQNNLLIRASDATGNNAELEVSLYLGSTTTITRASVYPNPTSGECTFQVYLESPNPQTNVRLQIADLQGRSIYSSQNTVPVAEGKLTWNGLDTMGLSVASGCYLWRIEVPDSDNRWRVARTGTVNILR